MEHKNIATIKEVQWQDVRKEVEKIKPEFAQTINELNSKFPLYIIEYPFGSTIIDEGVFFLPNSKGEFISVNDPRTDSYIQSQLNYDMGTIPFGIVLNGTVELFMQPEYRIIPFSLMKKGTLFALWSVLNPKSYLTKHVWSMVSGARCIFVLPKITEVAAYKRLSRARNIKQPLPRTLLSQFPILKQMFSHPEFKNNWRVRMLFFSKGWLDKHKEDKWTKFRLYLHEEAWNNTEYWRNKVAYDLIWDSFIRQLNQQHISASPRVVDIVNHLIMIGLGVVPGFCPATDEEVAPVKSFCEDFINIYSIKSFAPVMMIPHHFSVAEKDPVYWSFQLPTYLESSPVTRTSTSSIISEMRATKLLLDNFYKNVQEGKIKEISNTPLEKLIQEVKYDFFHSEPDMEGNIRPAQDLPKEDPRLINIPEFNKKMQFSDVSPFVRGCVRILRKK